MAIVRDCVYLDFDTIVGTPLSKIWWDGGRGLGANLGNGFRILYVMTRFYISQYEYWVTWRGHREKLRRKLRSTRNYEDWKIAAKELDTYLGADAWKADEAFAYYDYKTIKKAARDMSKIRQRAEEEARRGQAETNGDKDMKGAMAVDELRNLVELCVKSNFGGIESFRLYSQTYYGTKERVQEFVEEGIVSRLSSTIGLGFLTMCS